LLNVALSRAQDHLVVVANVDFMLKELQPGSEAIRMLHYLRSHAQLLPAEQLVPVRSAAELGGLDTDELARPAFFPADEVRRAVAWDIERAQHSVHIYCAFLAHNAVRQWLRLLRELVARGVVITVHTRKEQETSKAKLIEDLRHAGCELDFRERMHEKVLIVDERILWHGSLNLLAHSGSTDLMMRITDPVACQDVFHIVQRAKMDRPARPLIPASPSTSVSDLAPGMVVNGRLYLNVPKSEKEEAKRVAKARWDPEPVFLWHVDANTPRELVRRWLPPDD
jgi:hypothetical protein